MIIFISAFIIISYHILFTRIAAPARTMLDSWKMACFLHTANLGAGGYKLVAMPWGFLEQHSVPLDVPGRRWMDQWVISPTTGLFYPENWGRWTQFDEHIFQMGWNETNHQLGKWLVNGLFYLLINGVYLGYNPWILTFDPSASNGTSK